MKKDNLSVPSELKFKRILNDELLKYAQKYATHVYGTCTFGYLLRQPEIMQHFWLWALSPVSLLPFWRVATL